MKKWIFSFLISMSFVKAFAFEKLKDEYLISYGNPQAVIHVMKAITSKKALPIYKMKHRIGGNSMDLMQKKALKLF